MYMEHSMITGGGLVSCGRLCLPSGFHRLWFLTSGDFLYG